MLGESMHHSPTAKNNPNIFPFLQDRHAKGRSEPELDASQDWELLLGYENGTHTILRFRRPYDTCDRKDYRITGGTCPSKKRRNVGIRLEHFTGEDTTV
ncbi:hypothetical protein J437_LFUL001732 [Ladona fulva]|uniref:DOMON domain-containing protein n=1 Tax=Ladona fulva TaxID=123851 RepID=A0A8K0K003_LADFU|nr:hypothetical protein J437_LFUL001732 [Ladona fulva]